VIYGGKIKARGLFFEAPLARHGRFALTFFVVIGVGKSRIASMNTEIKNEVRAIDGRQVQVVVAPIGSVSLVYARTEKGLLTCGAIDPAALTKFGIPAARVRPGASPSIASFEDLLGGIVREANEPARALGIVEGLKGADALAKL
jgi:uncharacterized protein YunC (DUF1805 family)